MSTPFGTYHLAQTAPPLQDSQVAIQCPELGAVYYISRQDWERERRGRRLFERDFPRYNRALRYYDVELCNQLTPEGWSDIAISQEEYQPSSRGDVSPTPGFSIEESDLSFCSDTELFGRTVKAVPRKRKRDHGP